MRAQDTKICDDGSYVSRNPDLNCGFDPCPEEVGDVRNVEPIAEHNVIKRFFIWIKGIFS